MSRRNVRAARFGLDWRLAQHDVQLRRINKRFKSRRKLKHAEHRLGRTISRSDRPLDPLVFWRTFGTFAAVHASTIVHSFELLSLQLSKYTDERYLDGPSDISEAERALQMRYQSGND